MSQIELTYKLRDVEETIDVYFYRPFGYVIAIISKGIGITPNIISIISIIFGVIAGHLFYYNDLSINIIGIIILIFTETLDSADGQLARMTNKYTKIGRILDGFAGNLIFISIYLHICFRLVNDGFSILIFGIVLFSGFCHSVQNAMADYYRNAYLKFVGDSNKGEMDRSGNLILPYKEISWKKSFIEKFLLRVYLNYTLEQELFARNFLELLNVYEKKLNNESPNWLKCEYKRINKPMIKYYNILTTNTRMIILFISIISSKPFYYFMFELIILNLLLIYVFIRQDKNNKVIKIFIESKTGETYA